MLGSPGHQLEKIHTHISDLAKPIAMLNKDHKIINKKGGLH